MESLIVYAINVIVSKINPKLLLSYLKYYDNQHVKLIFFSKGFAFLFRSAVFLQQLELF